MPERPRRLSPRYVLSLAVRVQAQGLPSMSCEARNVGASGLFLATDKAPELSSRVAIALTLPSGQSGTLSARVVHVLARHKAERLGVPAGVGVHFDGLGPREQALVAALVTWARAHDPRPRVARRRAGADLSGLQHEPMLGFLLGYLDGTRDSEALAEELALGIDTIERMLAELERHGAIELVVAGEPGASQRAAASTSQQSVRPADDAQRIERVLGHMREAAKSAESEALRGRMSIPPPAPGPADGSDEHIDFRQPPPPSDAAPTAQHKRPGQEPSARARAAAAALRRPSRAPSAPLGRTSPPTQPPPGATARPGAAAPTRPPSADSASSARVTVRPGAASSSAVARAQPPSAASGIVRPSVAGPTQPPPGARAQVGSAQPAAPASAALRASVAPNAGPTQPPPGGTGRPSRAPAASRSGRPSRPAAAAQAEAAAQAAAEQAAAAAALISRGRPSQSPSRASVPAPNEPQLGAAGQILAQAEAAYAAGNTPEAGRHLKLLLAMTFDDPRLQARFAELKQKVMRTAAVDFEKQAAHEERQQQWAQAARSWLRVAEGRPTDHYPLQRAALAQLQAGSDLRAAMESAKRAVELAPNDAEARRTLAKVYVAADMQASARRELEAAQRCSGTQEPGDEGPTGLLKRLLGRDDSER